MAPMKLTPKQARFVQEYLIDLNAAQAAIRAGYSAKTARVIGHENLTNPDIAAAIEKAMAERAERTRLTADWVVDELRKLAGANMDDCMKANPSGDPYLDLSALTRDQTAALQLKRAALVDLGRHLGLFEIKHRIAGELEVKTSARETLHARVTRHIAARVVAGGDRPPDGHGGGGN
jgi:phage terminase small subunit